MARCIRWMIRRDLPKVLEIEHHSYEFPWSEKQFLAALRRSRCVGIVVEGEAGEIIGFALYELHRHSLEIIDLAIHPNYRRRGIGTELVDYLKQKMVRQGRERINVFVSEDSLPAQLFLKRAGLRATEVLPGYYDEDQSDAYVMTYFQNVGQAQYLPINRISKFIDA